MVARYGFPKAIRLRGHEVFGPVIRKGGFAADDCLVVHVLPNQRSLSRFGITIPRRTGNAVRRNAWKRQIREAIRHCRNTTPEGYDFVIRPKKDAELDGQKIRRNLPKLFARALKRQSASNNESGSHMR